MGSVPVCEECVVCASQCLLHSKTGRRYSAMPPRILPLIVTFALAAGLLGLLYQQQGVEVTIGTAATAAPAVQDTSDLVRSLRVQLQRAERRALQAEADAARASSAPRPDGASRVQQMPAAVVTTAAVSTGALATRLYIHTTESLPAQPGDLMMMTYATGGVREMLHNWVLHVQRLGLPVLVAAMDKQVVEQCTTQHFDCLDWSHTGTDADRTYVRGSFDGFRALGVRKLDALLPVLRAGVHVVLSDVDCVWSSSPLPLFHGHIAGFEDFRHADVLVATDCMSPEDDHRDHGCFHDTVDKNTGVLAIRATRNGIAAMAEWRIRLAVGQKDEQDQTTFNDLLDGNGRGHRWGMDFSQRSAFRRFAAEWCGKDKAMRGINALWEGNGDGAPRHTLGSRRIFTVCLPNATRDALVGVFPISDVAGGHTFFVQQLQTLTGKWPMAVHATYQFGDQTDYPFGKRQRFRDWGMWLADEDSELITASRYLVLEDEEALAPAEKWVGMANLHARGRQHVDHLDRLRQRLAHGFALARALNRTVVLPTLWCYCDKFWHRLSQCAIPSATSSQPLPFVCPLDHVLDPTWFHGSMAARTRRPRPGMLAGRADGPWEEGLPFRGRHWLRQLGAHPRVGYSVATLSSSLHADASVAGKQQLLSVEMLAMTRSASTDRSAEAAEQRKALAHEFFAGTEGPHVRLLRERTDVQLRQALQQYDHVRLLRVKLGEARALLKCHEQRQDAHAMQQLSDMLFQHQWCYRPMEMTSAWSAVERRGKPRRGDEPWCVWGFASPRTPPAC